MVLSARPNVVVGILGLGRLGSALLFALDASGYTSILQASRGGSRVSLPGQPVDRANLAGRADLVFLTVPDQAIEEAAAELEWRPGQVVVHTSGARALDALAAVEQRGATAACFHPLQTFPTGLSAGQASARFRDITCGIEGRGRAGELLEAIASSLGAQSVRLEGVDRAAYHAAAVFVSNDVIALTVAASRAWEQAGLPAADAQRALAPLIRASADGISERPLAQALTGPLVRGDVDTIERHLAALARDPSLADLYRRLALELLTLDLGHSAELRAALQRVLDR